MRFRREHPIATRACNQGGKNVFLTQQRINNTPNTLGGIRSHVALNADSNPCLGPTHHRPHHWTKSTARRVDEKQTYIPWNNDLFTAAFWFRAVVYSSTCGLPCWVCDTSRELPRFSSGSKGRRTTTRQWGALSRVLRRQAWVLGCFVRRGCVASAQMHHVSRFPNSLLLNRA